MRIIRAICILLLIFLSTCNFADNYLGVNSNILSEDEEEDGGGGGAFAPTSISGLALWLDASDTSTITTSGLNVTQWNDKSGNGRNFVQTVDANRPNINTGINSKNTILFTQASLDRLVLGSGLIDCVVSTIFILYKPATDTSYYFLGYDTGAGNYRISVSAASTLNIAYTGITALNFTLTNVSDNNSHFIMVKLRGNNNFFYASFDGNDEISSSPLNLIKANYPFNTLCAIYNTPAPTAATCFNGDIAEVIIYTTELSVSNKQKIEGYLAWKWGLTANLPAIHPYKNSAP